MRASNKVEYANHGFTDHTDRDAKGIQSGADGEPGSVAIVIPENFLPQEITNKPLPIYPLPETVPVTETIRALLHSKPNEAVYYRWQWRY